MNDDDDEILELSFGAGRGLFRIPLSKCIPCSLDFDAEGKRDLERHKNGHKRFGKDMQGGADKKNTKKRYFEDISGISTSLISEQSVALNLEAQIAEGETTRSDDNPFEVEESTTCNQKPPAEITLYYAPEDTEKKYGYDVSDDTIAGPPDFSTCTDPTPWSELSLRRRISRIRQYAIFMRRTTKKTNAEDFFDETTTGTTAINVPDDAKGISDESTTATNASPPSDEDGNSGLYYAHEDKERKHGYDVHDASIKGPPKYPGCRYSKLWSDLTGLQRRWRVSEYVKYINGLKLCGQDREQRIKCTSQTCAMLIQSTFKIPARALHGTELQCSWPQCSMKKPRYCAKCNKAVSSNTFMYSHETEAKHAKAKERKKREKKKASEGHNKKSGDEKKVSKPAPHKWRVKGSIAGKSRFIGTFASIEEAEVAHAVVDIFASPVTLPGSFAGCFIWHGKEVCEKAIERLKID